jgi:hypothetical protein
MFDVLTFGETMIVLIPGEPGPMELRTEFKPALAASELNCTVRSGQASAFLFAGSVVLGMTLSERKS